MVGLTAIEEDADRVEAELLARVAAGDRDGALVDLYRRHAGALLRLGVRLLGDREGAEELVQETFVRVWRSAGTFDPSRSTVRGWIFMIARRVAIDQHRRASARPKLTGADVPEEIAAPGDDLQERVARDDVVRDALRALPVKHREVLELSFDRDLADGDIAQRLGIPVGTVRSRTFYALRALRGELSERGVHHG